MTYQNQSHDADYVHENMAPVAHGQGIQLDERLGRRNVVNNIQTRQAKEEQYDDREPQNCGRRGRREDAPG